MKEYIVHNILQDMPVGLIVIDGRGDVVATNAAVARITGVSQEDLTERSLAEIFFEREENVDFNNVIVDVIMNKHIHHHDEVSYIKPDGSRRHLSITSSFLREDKDFGIVILIDDRTEEHECLEREKRMLIERSRLEHERAESLKHFAMSVAHQVRNPLVPIAGYAHRMLVDTPESAQHREYLTRIEEGVERIEHVINTVAEYSEIDTMAPLKSQVLPIIHTGKSTVDDRAKSDGRKIRWEIAMDAEFMTVDPYYFGIVFRDLFLNAYEAYPQDEANPRIEVRTAEEGGKNVLTVRDRGAGFNQEHRAYMFDAFFTTKMKSTGMGLAKAYRIVHEHGGTIDITRENGEATVVTIRLPLGEMNGS